MQSFHKKKNTSMENKLISYINVGRLTIITSKNHLTLIANLTYIYTAHPNCLNVLNLINIEINHGGQHTKKNLQSFEV